MARPELGIKRQCQNCGAKFYDLGHDPATCPKCGTVQQVVAAAVVTRGRAEPARRAEANDKPRDEEALVATAGAAEAEEGTEAAADEDEDIAAEGDDAGDEDAFLEEEEEDTDGVSGLIDGDIEDEES